MALRATPADVDGYDGCAPTPLQSRSIGVDARKCAEQDRRVGPRSALVALALVAALGPLGRAAAQSPPAADRCAPARIGLEFVGVPSTFSSGPAPWHAFFRVRNRAPTARTVGVLGVTSLASGRARVLRLEGVHDTETGRALARPFRLRAHGTQAVTLDFEPPPHAQRYRFRARLDVDGCVLSAATETHFVHRDPVRHR
jgi:hypothetical protein